MEERKLISVLFVDMVGSTARAHGADPEDVRDVLRRFQRPVREQVELHGGVLEKLIGDAVVAVFGTPRAHGDDAVRAVRCGLRIAAEVAEMNRSDATLELAVRAGVATGEALVELSSEPARGEAIAIGDVLNTAARLQSFAPEGCVVVGAETWRASRRAIRYQALPPVTAKGIPEPVPVWQALGEAEVGAADTPIVGREAELQQLQDAFREVAAARRPRLVTVLGEPGIGKSRLIAEFGAWIEQQGGAWLRGRSLPYSERRAYQATVDQVKQAAAIFEADEPQLARHKAAGLLHSVVDQAEAAALIRPLALVLALGLDEPMSARQPLFFAVRRLMEGLAARRPTAFVFEDMHWADESQLELLEELIERTAAEPALFVVVARPELRELRPALTAAESTIALSALPQAAATDLARQLLGTMTEAAQRLVEAAAGNPLFLEELAAAVREHGEGGRLPVTVREAIAAHVDSLPAVERTVLLEAAVIGGTFWRRVLEATATDSKAVGSALDALTARGLVRLAATSRVEGDDQFGFKHVLVQEVAYGTLTRADRRRRHAAVAAHLEEVLGADKRDMAAFLAHHWREAGETDKALDHLLLAADAARDAWAHDEMDAFYGTALELVAADEKRTTDLQLRKALALVRLGDFPSAADLLDAILPRLSGRDEVEAVFARTYCAYWLEDTQSALTFGERGQRVADALGDPELMAVAAMYAGLPHEYTGDLDKAQREYSRAHKLWVPGTRVTELATLNEYAADVAYWTGHYDSAELMARQAFELGGGGNSLQAMLRGGAWVGLCIAAQGRSEEALDWLAQVLETAQQLDSRWGAGTLNYRSLPLRDMFRLDEARDSNLQALELVSTRGAWGMAELQAEYDLCFTDLMLGEPGRVQTALPRLWDATVNGRAWRPWLGGLRLSAVRAELSLRTAEAAQTAEDAQDALDRAISGRRPKYEAAARAILGTALVRLGQMERGVAEMRLAVRTADRLAWPTQRWQLRAELARVLYATGDDDGAQAVFAEAARLVSDYGAGLKEENRRQFLEAEPVRAVLKGE